MAVPTTISATMALPDAAPPSPLALIRGLAVAGLSVIGIFVIGLGVWSWLAPLESAAVAGGVIEVETYRKTVQHLEGGMIGQIFVKDGDEVTEGQPLVRLDDTKALTTFTAIEGQFLDALARRARLIAERDELPEMQIPGLLVARAADPIVADVVSGQKRIFETRRTLLLSKIALIRQRIEQTKEEIRGLRAQEAAAQAKQGLIREEIADLKDLVAKGLERKPRLLQLSRDQADIEGSKGQLVAQIARAQQNIAESELNILTLRNDSNNEVAQQLRETEQKSHELREQVQAARDVLARVEIRAPESGIVTDLKVHTTGGVVNPGEPLLDIVPRQDRTVVKVQVRPEDMDLVRVGLPAEVRLLPYKQRRTPPIAGTVIHVSADRLVDDQTGAPYYLAKVEFNEQMVKDLPEVELIPGMPAEVMIKTGKRTVALYALGPILDSFHRAFREK